MKSILTFKNWTKKMSKKWMAKRSLLRKKIVSIMKKYRVILNQKKIFYYDKFFIFFAEKYLGFFYIDNISMEINDFYPKKTLKYECKTCDFNTCNKKDYNRHTLTKKHMINVSQSFSPENTQKPKYECICGKIYKENSGLWRHKKVCNIENETKEQIEEQIEDKNDKLIEYLMKENKEIKELILEIVKNGTHNTTTTNSHNKAFNLNFFLNETCKNAMNITDFVDSIKLQLSDLMNVGELGYVEGISKIIVKNLNNLDETIRPIHCTDKKRETFYVKDQGQWEKEDEDKKKITKIIKTIEDKNIRLLPQFREKYPEYKNSSSKISDKYDKIVIEAMSSDKDKEEKIIKNILTATIINK